METCPITKSSTEPPKKKEHPDPAAEQLRKAIAEITLRPEAAVANLLLTLNPALGVDGISLYEELRRQSEAVAQGNTDAVVAALMAQAAALQALFVSAVTKMTGLGAQSAYFDSYWRIALKAQNQARMTLTDAARIVSPKPAATFVKAVAQNQQINLAGESKPPQIPEKSRPMLENELNGGQPYAATMDRLATASAGRAYPADAALEEGDRAAGYEPD